MFLKNKLFFASLFAFFIGSLISCNSASRDIKIGSTLDESYAVKTDDIRDAINKGIHFLLSNQNSDGSWGTAESLGDNYDLYLGTITSHDAFREASSALCCMALMQTPGYDDRRNIALNEGLSYLMSQPPEGRANGDALYHTWSLIYVTQCLSRAIKYEHNNIPKWKLAACIRRWLAMLENMQSADGGWTYYDFGYALHKPSGFESNSFTTAAALDALWDAQKAGFEVNPKVKTAALKCLERLRTPEKSFYYATDWQLFLRPEGLINRPNGSLGRTQSCNLMLFLNAKIPVADLELGLDRLFQEHHFIEMGENRPIPHESWYATSGYFFLFGHFYAAGVIAQLPQEKQSHYWKALARAILKCQQQDSSWWDYPMYGYHKFYGTGFALLTLSPALKSLSALSNSSKPR